MRRLGQQRCGEGKACGGDESDWREAAHVAYRTRHSSGGNPLQRRIAVTSLPLTGCLWRNYIFMTSTLARRCKVCTRFVIVPGPIVVEGKNG
jgi:hypothetical protein